LKRIFLLFFPAVWMAASATCLASGAERAVTLATTEGNRQSFLLQAPSQTQASVILFAGGSGVLDIDQYGLGRGETNFLVRSRSRFVEHGLAVAVVDASSAYNSYDDGLTGFRSSESHARDIASVVSYLRKSYGAPVWAVGTSRGTISAANLAARLASAGPDGVVLTASVTGVSRKRPERVFDTPLMNITTPVLLVHHKRDACKVTPHSGMKRIKKKLKQAKIVELMSVTGGVDNGGNPCRGLTHHGFYGLEEEVVAKIARWIKRF
jgi:pimeloyl-ACP methyl ester carboxylesterase